MDEGQVLRARLDAQVAEALSTEHRVEALAVLGPGATRSQIMTFFILKHGASFAKDWEMTMSDFNRWVTGINLGRDPDPIDCYLHYVQNVPSHEQRHHCDLSVSVEGQSICA
ncbi:MAG: hypothetical protein WC537_01500 [Candidatus Paceibacterota bacterium]